MHQLYNNAGVALSRSVLETEYGDYEWLFAVNPWGVIHGTKAFLPRVPRGRFRRDAATRPALATTTLPMKAISATALGLPLCGVAEQDG